MDCSNNALLYPGGGAALRKVSGSTGNAVSEILVIPNGAYSEIFSGNDCIEWELRFIFAAAATGSVVVEECADRSASAGGETLATVNLVAKLTDRYISGGMRTGYFRVHNSSGQNVTVYIQKRISSADYEVRIGALESSSVDYGNRIDDLEGGGSGSGSEGGSGLSVEAIDALPVANSFVNGDRLIVSKGVEPATLTGTCAGVSSNPNVTQIGDASVSVDSGLNAVDFAAAIVAALDNPAALELMKASSIDDNGDGTFEVSHYPGVFANSIVSSGSDGNPSFEVTYPGSSELEQIDRVDVIPPSDSGTGVVLIARLQVNLNDTTHQDVYTVPAGKILLPMFAVWHTANPDFSGGNTASMKTYASVSGLQMSATVAGGSSGAATGCKVTNVIGFTIAAGDKVQAGPDVAYGSAATAMLELFGVLMDTGAVPLANVLVP